MDTVDRQEPESSVHKVTVEEAEAEYIKKISKIAQKEESTASNTILDTRRLSNE